MTIISREAAKVAGGVLVSPWPRLNTLAPPLG
jgi:hypothetical protein